MNNKNLEIVSVSNLLKETLGIPIYQRPYRWTTESSTLLFNDMYDSFKKVGEEYRIGTVVLHRDAKKENILMIVDGQQRITTLSILLYCISGINKELSFELEEYLSLLEREESYNSLSIDAVRNNHEVLKSKCEEHKDELKDFYKYILTKCTFVKIITDSEQQAFQFFDSQNSRGKELAPHDLLKSYHLREMNSDSLELKLKLIGAWEKVNQENLAKFFSNHLYPLINWYKRQSGINYSVKQIKSFKGVKQDNKFNYAVYHKAASLYIERFNTEKVFELTSGKEIVQFQLTQPVVAGRRFFTYTLYYLELYERVISIIENEYKELNPIILDKDSGNGYVRNLFINVVMFFIDKFDESSLSKTILNKLYKWVYSLRLVMYSVYIETVNNYALGRNKRANDGLNMFNKISEMTSPAEMDAILLDVPDINECQYTKKDELYNVLFGENK